MSEVQRKDNEMAEKLKFQAYIPPLQSAITFGDDTARVKLDIPPQYRDKAKSLIDLQGQVLNITVESEE